MTSEVDYVGQEAQELAVGWEQRLRKLDARAGFLFVSVRPLPAPEGKCSSFNVWVGISKQFETETAIAVIRHAFDEEIKEGKYTINASAVRGVHGAARDSSDENPHPLAS